MENFTKTIHFQTTENTVYDALTNSIPKWWTEMFDGVSNEQGKTFTIRFGSNVFKTMLIEGLVPKKKVVWKVIDSLIDIPDLKHKTEWIDTEIVWELSSTQNQTSLHLTHIGLTPQVECFNICEAGWHNFTDSLTEFINTGIGRPYKP
jgi:hypothetical protein